MCTYVYNVTPYYNKQRTKVLLVFVAVTSNFIFYEQTKNLTSASSMGAFLNFFMEVTIALAILSGSLSSQIDFFLLTTVWSRMVPFSWMAVDREEYNNF